MGKTYSYRHTYGFNAKELPPDVAAEGLAEVKATGPLTPERTVEAAEPEEAPLHPAFEWDDSEAARQYRLTQAASLIRAVYVVHGEQPAPEPIYVRVVDQDDGPRYETAVKVVRDEDLYDTVRQQFVADIRAAQRSLGELEQIASRLENKARAKQIARARKPLAAALEAATM